MDKNVNSEKYQISESSFRLVNKEKRITDTQLKTKPSSFAKDSFRRFCKNKSSIVGAIVLGVLILMSLIVPIVSPYDTEKVSVDEQKLLPKLFEAGTGFWDGTRRYEKKTNVDGKTSGVLYDFKNDTPAGFNKSAVYNLKVDKEPSYMDNYNPYASGGFVMFEIDGSKESSALLYNYNGFNATAEGNYVFSAVLDGTADVSGEKTAEYRVYIRADKQQKIIVLKDWSKDYSDISLNISDALKKEGLSELKEAKVYFEIKSEGPEKSYILIKECVFSCDDEQSKDLLAQISFTDANEMVGKVKDGNDNFPIGYWGCTGRKGIYAATGYYCEFTYDTYEAAYGKREQTFTITELKKLKEQGYCDFNESDIVGTFKKLTDDCPITEVYSPNYSQITGKLLDVKAQAYNYYRLGYTRAPKFILGTDDSGVALFTRMFTGLRTSLLLGVCTAAFCFLFGLAWGSISGYFGGTTDLVMERFCDILGGVPWIVVMTLAILHLGNNFFTFFLALCLTGWMGTAARTRTQFYRFKGGEYVLASRTLGAGDMRLIFKHILPNALGTIVTSSVLMIVSTIYSESTLAYLNLGLQGVQAFGVLLAQNQQYIQSNSYLIVHPSIVMALLMISFNLFGNGLRDALNPSLRGTD